MTIAEEARLLEAGSGPAVSRNVSAAHNPMASLNAGMAGLSRTERVGGTWDFLIFIFERTSQNLGLILPDADGQPGASGEWYEQEWPNWPETPEETLR